jgi:putative transposase
VIYAFIETHAEYPVVKWAKYFEVSTSGYYSWLRRRSERDLRDEIYAEEVERIFLESRKTYGAERIGAELRRRGYSASFRKVRQVMRERNLRSVHVKKVKPLTDSRKARGDGFPNLLRGRKITKPFEALSSDISYIQTDEGFDYLCQIRDIDSGVILASQQHSRMNKELVIATIKAAHKRWHLSKGTIFHSDRGSQYTSKDAMKLLALLGFQQSFSRVGMPGDNPWSESFFSILKKEAIYPYRFITRECARQAVFSYIETFYNRYRIQKNLGWRSPLQWLSLSRLDAA